MATSTFPARLSAAVQSRGTPLIVGLDPRLASLPEKVRPQPSAPPADVAASFVEFCRGVIDVVAPLVPAVKPQAAFFEQLGSAGVVALAEVMAHARSRGLLVLLDAKRGDIGSTAEAYADGLLGPSPGDLGGDALTVSPYLGGDTLEPFIATAMARGSGIFVLVKTSNPGSGQFQDLQCAGGRVYEHVARAVNQLSKDTINLSETDGQTTYGSVGAVVGATYPEQLAALREAMPHCWILVPGFGAQGGTASDVAPAFDDLGLGAIVNSSRGIIFAHSREEYAHFNQRGDWQQAVEHATRDAVQKLAGVCRLNRM